MTLTINERTSWPSTRIWPRDCAICTAPFVSRHRKRRVCYAHTKDEARRLTYQRWYVPALVKNPEVAHTCKECGRDFTSRTHSGVRVWCSARCSMRARKRARKHALRAGQVGERFTLLEIAVRDGWRCHLCRKRVARKDASLDHLIPVSRGGLHVRSNVALAHHRCNSRRSNTGPAQLLLIG